MTFTPTAVDLVAAYRLNALARLLRWRTSGVCLAVGALLVLGFHVVDRTVPPLVLIAILSASLAGGALLPLAQIALYLPFVGRRIYSQQRNLHGAIEVDWNADRVRTTQAVNVSETSWAHYRRWRENRTVVLLYHSDALFQFLPKRVLAPAQTDELRAFAAAGGVCGAGRRARRAGDAGPT